MSNIVSQHFYTLQGDLPTNSGNCLSVEVCMLGNKQTSDLQTSLETLKHLVERTMEYAKKCSPLFGGNSFMGRSRVTLIITPKSLDSRLRG